MAEKKCIIFTDLKDFTYKNSLLTDSQISQILTEFHAIVAHSAQEFSVQVIKSIGDAYFCITENAADAYNFSQKILLLSTQYDEKQNLDLKKISLRITITYGKISQNVALSMEDYFGEAINLGARIMDMTPAGKIFVSEEFLEQCSGKYEYTDIGEFEFHGLLKAVSIYSFSPMSQQEIALLRERDTSFMGECENIVFRASAVAAVLSVQPIPFLENFNLIIVQLYMLLHIAAKFEKNISLSEGSRIFGELIAPLGLSYAVFQGSASAVKILLPGIGGFLFAPLSFSVSYALGKIYILYFYYESKGEKLSPELIKELFSKHKKDAKNIAKERKKEIFHTGKKYLQEVLAFGKQNDYSKVQQDTIRMLKKN